MRSGAISIPFPLSPLTLSRPTKYEKLKIALDNSVICTILTLVDNCVWECGSLFTLSGAEGLPLFFFLKLFFPRTRLLTKEHLFQNHALTKCNFVTPFFDIHTNCRGYPHAHPHVRVRRKSLPGWL